MRLTNIRVVRRMANCLSVHGDADLGSYHIWVNPETLEVAAGFNGRKTLYLNPHPSGKTRYLDAEANCNRPLVTALLGYAKTNDLFAKFREQERQAEAIQIRQYAEERRIRTIQEHGVELYNALKLICSEGYTPENLHIGQRALAAASPEKEGKGRDGQEDHDL